MVLPCIIISFFFFNETPSSQSQDAINKVATLQKSEPEIQNNDIYMQHSATDNVYNDNHKPYSYSPWTSFDVKFDSEDDETPQLPLPKQPAIAQNNDYISNETKSEYVHINVNNKPITSNNANLNKQSNTKHTQNNTENIKNNSIKQSQQIIESNESVMDTNVDNNLDSENGLTNLKDSDIDQDDNNSMDLLNDNKNQKNENNTNSMNDTISKYGKFAGLLDEEHLFQNTEMKIKSSVDEKEIFSINEKKHSVQIDTSNENNDGLLSHKRNMKHKRDGVGHMSNKTFLEHMVVKTGKRVSLFNHHHERNSTKQLKRGVTCVNDVTNKARSSEIRRKGYLLKLHKEEQNAMDKQRELDRLRKTDHESQNYFD
eukprot:123159_1